MTDLRKAAEMALEFVDWLCGDDHSVKPKNNALKTRKALRQALAQPEQEPVAKVWLWRNFVNDKPEYWAFDNPYPINLDNDDPQTIGSPCGYAILKPSRDGSRGRKEDEVLREIKGALAREQTRSQSLAQPEQEPVSDNKWKNVVIVFNDKDEPPITGNEYDGKVLNRWSKNFDVYLDGVKGQICTAPPKREWVGLTDREITKIGNLDWDSAYVGIWYDFAKGIEAKLKEKNT